MIVDCSRILALFMNWDFVVSLKFSSPVELRTLDGKLKHLENNIMSSDILCFWLTASAGDDYSGFVLLVLLSKPEFSN